MKDFFVSYNKADRAWAEWIAWQLEEKGYTTVVQPWDFLAGDNFMLDVHKAASEAQRTIAVLSPDYLAAPFTQPEWAAALAQDPTSEDAVLLPVRVRACELKGLLRQIVYIDLVGLDEETARERLLAGVLRTRAKPSQPPRFPGGAAQQNAAAQAPRYPGVMPSIWNVPHQRNQNFTGRDELLAQLEKSLRSGQATALTQQAIHGLGGVGKTQLAVEYAYRHTADYDVVWWIRSEQTATLAADYAALAQKLNLPEKDATEQAVVVEAVRHWLDHNVRWLLIFDNVNEPKDLDLYRPQGSGGQILITSRYSAWRSKVQPLEVEELDRAESIKFLLKRTGQTDEAAANKLAEALGDLPLALEHAGAYIDATGISLAEYLRLFESYQTALFDESEPTEYPTSITKTWDLAFQRVQQASPAAVDLLNLCAFFAPDDIPLDMIKAGEECLPEALKEVVHNPLALNKAIAALRCYSLIDLDDGMLSVHRMVQAVTRDRLSQEECERWIESAVQMVDEKFPFKADDVQTWAESACLLSHALVATNYAQTIEVALDVVGHLLNEVGLYFRGRAQFVEAKTVLERAVRIFEVIDDAEHLSVAICLNNLGTVLRDLSDLAGAKAAYERALRIDEATYGPDHPKVSIRVNNLGLVLKDLGNLAEAKAAYERALRIGEATYGSEHPQVALYASNLGNVFRDLGDLAEAKAACERALRIGEATHGLEHPQVAIYANNLGLVLQDLGDLAGARVAYERALRIDEAIYGRDHPAVATDVNNLGYVLQYLGDLVGAKAAYERALRIDEVAYGLEHPDVATEVNNLGNVLRNLGDLVGAKVSFERALRIFRQFLGDNHPNTVLVRKNLERLEREIREANQGEQDQ